MFGIIKKIQKLQHYNKLWCYIRNTFEKREMSKMKNKKKKYSVIAIVIIIVCSITVISTAKEKSFVSDIMSNLKQSKQERIKKKEEKFKQKILDKLEKKYGEKFSIISEYDGDVFMGDMDEYVVVANEDDSYRFRVEVDFDTYRVYGDTYMIKYLYPKYEAYVKKTLYNKYGDKVTLDDIQMKSSGYSDTITKDTPIEKTPNSVLENMYPNMTIYVSEELLSGSSPKEMSYDIAKLLVKNKATSMLYIAFLNKDYYNYGINLREEYNKYRELGSLKKLRKKYFVFFSKNEAPYEEPYYWLTISFDAKKGKYYIDDMEENNLLDTPNLINSLGYKNIVVSGHSKGGNLAEYVALLSDNVVRAISYDGQGFSNDFYEKHRNINRNKSKKGKKIFAYIRLCKPYFIYRM